MFIKKYTFFLTALVAGLSLFISCAPEEVALEGVVLSQQKVILRPDDQLQLFAVLDPENVTSPKTRWISSDLSVALVDESGMITAKSYGKSDIIVVAAGETSGGTKTFEDTCQVIVSPDVTGFSFDVSEIELYVSQQVAIQTVVTPDEVAEFCTIEWKSENTEIAIVDSDGFVRGVSRGITKISATLDEFTISCNVTVKQNVEEISICIDELKTDKAKLSVGDALQLTASLLPEAAMEDNIVTWSIDKPDVASIDNSGKVKALSMGKATITAEAGGKSAMCALSVYDGEILTIDVEGSSFDMFLVESGTFYMGASAQDEEAYDREKPLHTVTISNDYYICETEITQEIWSSVMGNNPSSRQGEDLPMDSASWLDALEFISELNEMTGLEFRLPTEAEWEYAARGGHRLSSHKYPGSDICEEVAFYAGNSGDKIQPVASKSPNALGLYDMAGNVNEWCNDWYKDTYYSSSEKTDPQGPENGSFRIFRGGSCYSSAKACRIAYRGFDAPNSHKHPDMGIRLVLTK